MVFKCDRLSDHDTFKSMPKHKQDLIKNKIFIQDANEKELVSLYNIPYNILVFTPMVLKAKICLLQTVIIKFYDFEMTIFCLAFKTIGLKTRFYGD